MLDDRGCRGIVPAMITPLTDDGNIDIDGTRRLVNYLIDGGVHGLFGLSSSGEIFALTDEQKEIFAKTIVSEARDRVPVYIGASSPSLSLIIPCLNSSVFLKRSNCTLPP